MQIIQYFGGGTSWSGGLGEFPGLTWSNLTSYLPSDANLETTMQIIIQISTDNVKSPWKTGLCHNNII